MTDDSDLHCYAFRRVNPFIGVQQVLETPVGRASSTSGNYWELEIDTERARVLGGLERDASGRAFIRFGRWSPGGGHLLANSRHSLMQDRELREKCEQLIEALQRKQPELPFTLVDTRELWLLDESGQVPLALLATAVPGQSWTAAEPRDWRCSLGADGVPGQARFDDSRRLEAQVKRRAGYNVKRAWLSRQPDGCGIRESDGVPLQAGRLPGMLIARHWHSAEEAEVVEQYLRWIAPSLLTLSFVDDEERDWLERQLHVQAVAVEHHWQLYPKMLAPKRIKAARVQSRLTQPVQA